MPRLMPRRRLLPALIPLALAPALLAHDTPACPGVVVHAQIEGLDDPTDVVVRGGYAHVLDGGGGDLLTFDVSVDPPALVSSITLPLAQCTSIVAHADAAYLTAGSAQILVLDLTDPASPAVVSTLSTSSPVENPTVIAGLMYAGTTDILDVSDPLAPTPAGTMALPSPIGGHDEGMTFTTQLQRVDLSDPLSPALLPSPAPLGDARHAVIDVDIDAQRLYALSDEHFTVRDLSDPANPATVYLSELAEPLHSAALSLTRRGALVISGGNTSGLSGASNLIVRDYSAPVGFTYTDYRFGVFDSPGESIRLIRESDGLAYLLSQTMLTIAELSAGLIISTTPTPGAVSDIRKHTGLLLTAEDGLGAGLYDASNPEDIRRISSYEAIDTANGVDASGTVMYVAADRQDLHVVDISDPASPTLITTIETGFRTMDVRVDADTLFVVNRSTGLLIYDISDPASPTHRSTLSLPGCNSKIDLSADRTLAAISSGPFDTSLIDISDPDTPAVHATITPLSTGTSTAGINSASIDGSLLYTAEHTLGYRVWDISTPAAPALVGHITYEYPKMDGLGGTLDEIAYRAIPHNRRLLIANGNNGLAVFDNVDPAAPRFERYFATEVFPLATSSVRSITIEGETAFAGVYGGGIKAYRLEGCWLCMADLTGDGRLNFFDVTAFISAYADQSLSVDFNNDYQLDFFDVSAFLVSYGRGCP